MPATLDESLIRARLGELFDDPNVEIEQVFEGRMNDVYEVQQGEGIIGYFKCFRRARQFQREYFALTSLQERGVRFIPRILAEGHYENQLFLVLSPVPGQTLEGMKDFVTADTARELFVDLGKMIGTCHSIQLDGYGIFDARGNIHQARSGFANDAMEGFQRRYEWCMDELLDELDLIKQVYSIVQANKLRDFSGPVMVHYDLMPFNLYAFQDRGQAVFTGVIDFETATAAEAFVDMPKLYMRLFARHPWAEKFFWAGYRQKMKLPDDWQQQLHLHFAITGLAILEYCIENQVPDRQRAEARALLERTLEFFA